VGQRFTFRAQPALDLRRREHDAARRALAVAEHQLSLDERRFGEARDTLSDARRVFAHTLRDPSAETPVAWHRVWMLRLEQALRAHAASVEASAARVATAREEWARTRQRAESLARLKDKAQQAWARAEELRERKESDALAVMRYRVAAQASPLRGA
jgi:flagellar export protein FliJ